MKHNKNVIGHMSAVLTMLIWGTTFISTKILLLAFTPIEILFCRFTIGLLVLMAVYPHRLKVKDKKQEIIFAFAGLCGVTMYYLFENIALTYTMASNAGVIISVAPLFTAILAHFFLEGEKLKVNFLIGFLTAIVGIGLISFNGSTTFQINPRGDMLAVAAAMVWSVYSILTKKISAYGYHTIQTTRRIFFYGLLFMSPFLWIMDFQLKPETLIKPLYLCNFLFLGLGASALCFVTWNYAVKLLGVVKTSIYIYMTPVITVVTSVLILKEVITGMAAVGTALTLAGLFLSKSKIGLKKEKPASEIIT